MTQENKPSKNPKITKSAVTTIALLASGSVLGVTGVTFLASHWGLPVVWKAWQAIGVSQKAITVAHQVGAVGFLSAAAVHLSSKTPVIKKHIKTVVESAA
ncbi:MAG: hypothetical protein VSS75_005410 [Candidatus Parabeggiatoa sp.]|nr:membrane protein [Beggiatoa sp. SS]MEC4579776.1 hypothetical protein [Candidatus Parabeggiatoa sp.]